jgi:hypothetical protein
MTDYFQGHHLALQSFRVLSEEEAADIEVEATLLVSEDLDGAHEPAAGAEGRPPGRAAGPGREDKGERKIISPYGKRVYSILHFLLFS